MRLQIACMGLLVKVQNAAMQHFFNFLDAFAFRLLGCMDAVAVAIAQIKTLLYPRSVILGGN